MRPQPHDLHLLTGSYALDTLPEDERAEFERHLARCPSCAEEVRGLRETAARLAMAPAVYPPRDMRERVLAAALDTRQLPPAGRGAPGRAGRGAGWRRARLSRAGITASVLALAAAVAFLVVLQVSTNRQLRQAQQTSHAIAAVLNAPDARIESVPSSVGGMVTAVVSLHTREAVVTTAGLPRPPGTRVYQLWVISGSGAARSAGLLSITSPGSAATVLAAGVQAGDRLGVTIEPAGGTAKPTTTPVVIMPVSA